MKLRLTGAFTALVLAGTALVATTAPTQATAEHNACGTRSLATVLAADGHGFDRNANDFDIVDKLVTRVLAAKPNSRLGILTRGRQSLTAFLPTDGTFRGLVEFVTGQSFASERRVFKEAWKAAGLAGTERILLYHLVRGDTITYRQLRAAAPTRLKTMQGGFVRVRAVDNRLLLIDFNPDSPHALVIPALRNINKGNRQIAHGIDSVLSPD